MELEVTYERDIHKSYMKLPAIREGNFDEKIIVAKPIEGTLSCKKCFVQEKAEYWYDITGKQALDDFCRTDDVDRELFERIWMEICNCLEVLEWNLVDANCLMLRTDFIFLDIRQSRFKFLLYPECSQNITESLQSLMEFLLTKIDHKDIDLVGCAYQVYEYMLQGSYAISDIRNILLEKRSVTDTDETLQTIEQDMETLEKVEYVETETIVETLERKVLDFLQDKLESLKGVLHKIWEKEECVPEVVYPEDVLENPPLTAHPTVCLSNWKERAQGILVYEGKEDFADFEIGHLICVVGKSHRVKLQIEKDTISQFHAKIEWIEDVYYLEDMNSTNGTYVNDELLNYKERRALSPGDIVRFADVKYRFM